MPNEKLEDYNLYLPDIEVKCKIIEHQDLKAIISLNFGPFTVKGFRVTKSKYKTEDSEKVSNSDELWIVPPSYRDGGGKYHPTFFIPKKELWEELKAYIMQKYTEAVETYYRKRFDNPEF